MTLPHSQSENFSIVNTTPIFPEEFEGQTFLLEAEKMLNLPSEEIMQGNQYPSMHQLVVCKMSRWKMMIPILVQI